MTTWVDVDPAALAHNAREVRRLVGERVKLCAVVKGNGYGHGAVLAAEAFLAGGAACLGVTTVAEGIELRSAGVAAPILLLASQAPDEAGDVARHHLTATVSDLPAAERLSAAASAAGVSVKVHLLIDTGMGRDGCLPADAPDLCRQLHRLFGLEVEGVYTHFPNSIARNIEPTRVQWGRFAATLVQLEPRPPLAHAANSGATVDVPESRLDMVRVGTLLYGQYPSPHVSRELDLRETWWLRSKLVEVRRLPAGSAIGYGSETVLRSERLVGTLLVGWQHGFTLAPESRQRGLRGMYRALFPAALTVTIKGVACPVLGRVSMQSCAVDVTDVPDVAVGDVATVPCRRVPVDRAVPRVVVADAASDAGAKRAI
ncbi:MAG: alanine racemase [Armatimonadetes bacterium]|nr:alanine racemase [Armatimonadota bacterium]